jgi:hypothetical protein
VWDAGTRYLVASVSLAFFVASASCWSAARKPDASRVSLAALLTAFSLALAALTLAFVLIVGVI